VPHFSRLLREVGTSITALAGRSAHLERLANITKSFLLTALPLSVTYCNATMTNIPQARLKNTRLTNVRLKNLGEVEQLVMDYLWTHGPSSSEACREALASSRPMKDSTIRTVLRRLEEKGYLTHETAGRTFIYKASDARQNVAVRAVKSIIDRFCGGSAEQLVLGMVDNAVLNRKQLERLARKIAEKTIAEEQIEEKQIEERKPEERKPAGKKEAKS
jgi:BlaI family transcriptional regulator, penicillinase repressor